MQTPLNRKHTTNASLSESALFTGQEGAIRHIPAGSLLGQTLSQICLLSPLPLHAVSRSGSFAMSEFFCTRIPHRRQAIPTGLLQRQMLKDPRAKAVVDRRQDLPFVVTRRATSPEPLSSNQSPCQVDGERQVGEGERTPCPVSIPVHLFDQSPGRGIREYSPREELLPPDRKVRQTEPLLKPAIDALQNRCRRGLPKKIKDEQILATAGSIFSAVVGGRVQLVVAAHPDHPTEEPVMSITVSHASNPTFVKIVAAVARPSGTGVPRTRIGNRTQRSYPKQQSGTNGPTKNGS